MQAHVRGRESNFVSTPVCLPAGTYYVCLENPYFVRQEYALTVVCAAAEAVEAEPNDALAEATPLLQGRAYSGICSSRQDTDTYLLTVSPGDAPSLSFAFDPFGGEEAAYTLSLIHICVMRRNLCLVRRHTEREIPGRNDADGTGGLRAGARKL